MAAMSATDELRELLPLANEQAGPSWFCPIARRPDGTEYAHKLDKVRKVLALVPSALDALEAAQAEVATLDAKIADLTRTKNNWHASNFAERQARLAAEAALEAANKELPLVRAALQRVTDERGQLAEALRDVRDSWLLVRNVVDDTHMEHSIEEVERTLAGVAGEPAHQPVGFDAGIEVGGTTHRQPEEGQDLGATAAPSPVVKGEIT